MCWKWAWPVDACFPVCHLIRPPPLHLAIAPMPIHADVLAARFFFHVMTCATRSPTNPKHPILTYVIRSS